MSRHARRPSPWAAVLPAAAAVAALLGCLALVGTPLSGATFTSTTSTPLSVQSAADWAPPSVAVTPPGSTLTGTVTIGATASDTGSGVASVTIDYSPSGAGSWTTLCTTTTSPYGCSWNTALAADGSYDLRATAVDKAGFSRVSDSVTVRVANAIGVVLAPVADPAHGTVTLRVDYVNPNPTVLLVLSLQYSPAGQAKWATVPTCGSSVTPATTWSCAVDTTRLTNGADYDFRAVGTPVLGTTYYDVQAGVTVDNAAPTTVLTLPGGTLSGTVPLTATATDNETSVVTTAFQYRPAGSTGTWTTACTDTVTPYACSLSTVGLAKGSWEFRTLATDEAGNTGTSAVVTATVDNTVASVSVTAPAAGAVLRGTVQLTADAATGKGIANVALQYRLGATGAWQTVCTDTTAPYACSWDSTVVTRNSVDLQAVLTDSTGARLASSLVTVTVDNSVLRAQDVQGSNGGVLGKVDTGDKLVLTYSGVIDPTTVLTGWSGAATPITVTLNDAALAGGPGGGDWMTFAAGSKGTPVNLGAVAFGENYVKLKKTATLNATLAATTQTIGGQPVTVVTVTMGTTVSGGGLRQSSAPGTITWAPSTAVRTSTGVSCSSTPATETGAADQDL